jgi:hypothetical protein
MHVWAERPFAPKIVPPRLITNSQGAQMNLGEAAVSQPLLIDHCRLAATYQTFISRIVYLF